MARINAPMFGLSGFVLQPLAEHVGYSHSKHAQLSLCCLLCYLAGLKACRGFSSSQTLQRTVACLCMEVFLIFSYPIFELRTVGFFQDPVQFVSETFLVFLSVLGIVDFKLVCVVTVVYNFPDCYEELAHELVSPVPHVLNLIY